MGIHAMSDALQFVVDEHIASTDAEARVTQLRKKLEVDGWFVATADADCVLGAFGHRPGPQVRSWYARTAGEVDFTTLMTNGVVIEAGSFTNLAAGPFETDSLCCAACNCAVEEGGVMESVAQWMSGDSDAGVTCDACGGRNHLRALRSAGTRKPPVLCGNVVLTFYNWPPLDSPRWKTSILDALAAALGNRPAVAWTNL
jgi:hypothetical protein